MTEFNGINMKDLKMELELQLEQEKFTTEELKELEDQLIQIYDGFMLLKIFVDSNDEELKNKYKQAIYKHHLKLKNNITHIDAGFDLLTPSDVNTHATRFVKIDYKVICSASVKELDKETNTCFYMYPRSSISKSRLRLANNIGIIDSGYRGHLMGVFDIATDIYTSQNNIGKFDRHLQICAPGLMPIMVQLVDSIDDLGEKTARGDGGFGSTGI